MDQKQFAVGQVWKTRDGREATITEIWDASAGYTYPVIGRLGEGGDSWMIDGTWFADSENGTDLVELVTNADGTPALPLEATHERLMPGLDFVAGELKAFEPESRQKFIHSLIHAATVTAIEQSLMFRDVEGTVRDAVKLRDELLKAAD